ncbi:flagellin [Cellulomonas fimi]|uniref:Flagellin n=1 Tax=Cellulomonas fimi (strain ATCC 484 / DSM 20113 / JCM 1341 / CCUG 24087 / LMG 16345 / NBRC 15513 / NCIMB 8980 / NCTC 7547 / NRS-133) TaxID=590998 RepID=F4GYT5_CELFA|nr:flagellin [Cellulomonas fimi]AEE44804.1 flagellin domain protein [Cellulomonas fimi ATCC 484]NNH08380.1 flagellin [Cellulomonas fimi]VEH27336.1 A-type flagellin [Cellulomonas fimi]
MGLSINQNIAAVNSYRNLSNTQNDLSKSLEKLSSGFRINRAADDAAGLAISEGLRSQVGGLKVAARNAQDGISVVQTAEGALTETHAILQRLRDLSVQGANDSNNDKARANIKTEADSLVKELGRIGNSTNFNGTKLLDGSAGTLHFQVGADGDGNSRISVDLSGANVTSIADQLGAATTGSTMDVLTPTNVTGAFTFTTRETVGGNNVDTTITTASVGAAGSIKTVDDLAAALNKDTNFSKNLAASVNSDNQLVVTAKDGAAVFGGNTAGTHASAGTGAAASVALVPGTTGLDFSTADAAQTSIGRIDAQIEAVSTARAGLGAMQNRLEHTIKNINVSVENLSASESRIRDTDMASEMVSFTRAQILSQAGTAMLAQANQIPQGVLSLLR